MTDRNPRVSVVTITYNQQGYVSQTVDSVLSQECDFDYEYIISDDCSSDGTPGVLQEFADRYPEVIRLTLRSENVGAQRNLAAALAQCRGQYVAILDGDDLWTSPHKLQRQVAFMEANADCALSFHDLRLIDESGDPCDLMPPVIQRSRFDITDLLRENFISTCTVMYRQGLVSSLPAWWNDSWVSDYTLHVLHADKGWIGYIDDVMAAYRVHPGGQWSGEFSQTRRDEFIKVLRLLDGELDNRYHDVIERNIRAQEFNEFQVRFDRASKLFVRGENREARRYVPWLIRHFDSRGPVPMNAVVVLAIRSVAPWVIGPLVGIKSLLRRTARKAPVSDARKDERA